MNGLTKISSYSHSYGSPGGISCAISFPDAFLNKFLQCRTRAQAEETVLAFSSINEIPIGEVVYFLTKSLFEKGLFAKASTEVQDFLIDNSVSFALKNLFAGKRAMCVKDFNNGKRDPHLLSLLIFAIFEGVFISENKDMEYIVMNPKKFPEKMVVASDYISLILNKIGSNLRK